MKIPTRCVFGKHDPYIAVLVPYKDGSAYACIDCALGAGVYCGIHQRAHVGYQDGTSICPLCVQDEISHSLGTAERVYRELEISLPSKEFHYLEQTSQELAERIQMPLAAVAYMPIVLTAKRFRMQASDVVNHLIATGSTRFVLSPGGISFTPDLTQPSQPS